MDRRSAAKHTDRAAGERLFDAVREAERFFMATDAVHRALAIVVDAGWVRLALLENKTTGGRPSELYAINPRVWRAK